MGLFTSDHAAHLPSPLPRPQGVFPNHTLHGGVALRVREKKLSFSGDDFAIKDAATGRKLFVVSGRVLSISDRKTFHDAEGNFLFSLHKKLLTLHHRTEGRDARGNVLFTLKSALISIGAKFEIEFSNSAGDGSQVTWFVKGDIFDRKATITDASGNVCGLLARSFLNAGQVFFDRQSYVVAVAGGVDVSLMLAVAIVLDEIENEDDDL